MKNPLKKRRKKKHKTVVDRRTDSASVSSARSTYHADNAEQTVRSPIKPEMPCLLSPSSLTEIQQCAKAGSTLEDPLLVPHTEEGGPPVWTHP